MFFVGIIAVYFFPNLNQPPVEFDFGAFWNIWARWDGWHYIRNSINGYPENQPFTAFFPLFPILISGVSFFLKINPVFAGILISNISLIFAGYFLVKLVKLDFSEKIARKSFIFLLAFPSSVFLAAVYTESLFLFFTISTFYFIRKNQWSNVFIMSFLSSLTRILGVFLVFPIFFEYLKKNNFKFKKEIFSILGAPLGLGTYMFFLWKKFRNPLQFLESQKSWGREIEPNIFCNFFEKIKYFFNFTINHHAMALIEISFVFLFLFLIISAFFYQKIRKSYAIWMLVLFLPPVMQNVWTSTNRYVLVIFPAFILFSIFSQKFKFLGDLLLIFFGILLGIHISLFVNYFWAG